MKNMSRKAGFEMKKSFGHFQMDLSDLYLPFKMRVLSFLFLLPCPLLVASLHFPIMDFCVGSISEINSIFLKLP